MAKSNLDRRALGVPRLEQRVDFLGFFTEFEWAGTWDVFFVKVGVVFGGSVPLVFYSLVHSFIR